MLGQVLRRSRLISLWGLSNEEVARQSAGYPLEVGARVQFCPVVALCLQGQRREKAGEEEKDAKWSPWAPQVRTPLSPSFCSFSGRRGF